MYTDNLSYPIIMYSFIHTSCKQYSQEVEWWQYGKPLSRRMSEYLLKHGNLYIILLSYQLKV